MTELEQELCKIYGKKYSVFTGSGTTAIYLALKALGAEHKKIIFPAISCTNPVNAAIAAGCEVDFCDVNLSNYTMDLEYLSTMLEKEKYEVVVPTHIYGHFCNMSDLKIICERHNIKILEDAAQTSYLSGGDISITSFGHTKIYETQCGGGAAFTDNIELYLKMKEIVGLLPLKPYDINDRFNKYREEYYKIVHSKDNTDKKNIKMRELQINNAFSFIYHMDENSQLLQRLYYKDEINKMRQTKQLIYCSNLNKRYIRIPNVQFDKEVVWRFSFLYLKDRDKLLENVRKLNIDISNWYPSLAMIYKNQKMKNADIVSNEIVNLWVSEEHNVEQIIEEIEQINRCMEEE